MKPDEIKSSTAAAFTGPGFIIDVLINTLTFVSGFYDGCCVKTRYVAHRSLIRFLQVSRRPGHINTMTGVINWYSVSFYLW